MGFSIKLNRALTLTAVWMLCCLPTLTVSGQERNVFGEKSLSEAALMGIFYDLKQTQEGQPTRLDVNQYWEVLDEFFSKGWDETVLNRYYRITQPLYTTQIFVPAIGANAAPKAFGAGPNVKESRWVIHYKGQVSPPADGAYRFWGLADDIIAVAVDQRTVLVKPLRNDSRKIFPKTDWQQDPKQNYEGLSMSGGRLYSGHWLEMKSNQIYDLDVLIGERPGGTFFAFLMVEKQGTAYEQVDGHPVLPIFQVAPYDTPSGKPGAPRFAKGAVWKSYQ